MPPPVQPISPNVTGCSRERETSMAVWDSWSAAKKIRALIGVTLFGALLLYGLVMDLLGK
jgi:hypothetical protein